MKADEEVKKVGFIERAIDIRKEIGKLLNKVKSDGKLREVKLLELVNGLVDKVAEAEREKALVEGKCCVLREMLEKKEAAKSVCRSEVQASESGNVGARVTYATLAAVDRESRARNRSSVREEIRKIKAQSKERPCDVPRRWAHLEVV